MTLSSVRLMPLLLEEKRFDPFAGKTRIPDWK